MRLKLQSRCGINFRRHMRRMESGRVEIGGERAKGPRAGLGVCAGCFIGAGYGLAVGFGRLTPAGGGRALVRPTFDLTPFAHDGSLAGAFCGIAVGVGFGTMLAAGIGYQWDCIPELFANSARRERGRNYRQKDPTQRTLFIANSMRRWLLKGRLRLQHIGRQKKSYRSPAQSIAVSAKKYGPALRSWY